MMPVQEFERRIRALQERMVASGIDLFLIYGDEYRREHLRYVANYWPLFERGMLLVSRHAEPVLAVGPECQYYAREMSSWSDVRVLREMEVAYVSDEIDYTGEGGISRLDHVLRELFEGRPLERVAVCGIDAMSVLTLDAIKEAVGGAVVESGDSIVYAMRALKSEAEFAALSTAWKICDAGYAAFLEADLVDLTEIQAAAIAEKAARDAGAEAIVFSVLGSGARTNTVVGRATEKRIEPGEMVMYSLAVQYDGYIATNAWPLVAGGEPRADQLEIMRHLVRAEHLGIESIQRGATAGEVVMAVREYFRGWGLGAYDLYPPIHGNGLAEAESPYPDERSAYAFAIGTGINFDVSLFNVPGVGASRIEEGFIITDEGMQPLSSLIAGLRTDFIARYG